MAKVMKQQKKGLKKTFKWVYMHTHKHVHVHTRAHRCYMKLRSLGTEIRDNWGLVSSIRV